MEDPSKPGKVVVKTEGGEELAFDHVIIATGIVPNSEIAQAAGLEIDDKNGGIAVNAQLGARSNIWAVRQRILVGRF